MAVHHYRQMTITWCQPESSVYHASLGLFDLLVVWPISQLDQVTVI